MYALHEESKQNFGAMTCVILVRDWSSSLGQPQGLYMMESRPFPETHVLKGEIIYACTKDKIRHGSREEKRIQLE